LRVDKNIPKKELTLDTNYKKILKHHLYQRNKPKFINKNYHYRNTLKDFSLMSTGSCFDCKETQIQDKNDSRIKKHFVTYLRKYRNGIKRRATVDDDRQMVMKSRILQSIRKRAAAWESLKKNLSRSLYLQRKSRIPQCILEIKQ